MQLTSTAALTFEAEGGNDGVTGRGWLGALGAKKVRGTCAEPGVKGPFAGLSGCCIIFGGEADAVGELSGTRADNGGGERRA